MPNDNIDILLTHIQAIITYLANLLLNHLC